MYSRAAPAIFAPVFRLENSLQRYDWGSTSAIPELLGNEPDGTPQAEMWIGAHQLAPSRDSEGVALSERIARAPLDMLGPSVIAQFGPHLPFLLKVLAASQPLSIQTHPSSERARAGFAREEAAGVPHSAPHRSYRDANAKPELICALSRFEALCGFQSQERTASLFDSLGLPSASIRAGLAGWLQDLYGLSRHRCSGLVRTAASGCARGVAGFEGSCRWGASLARAYPEDPGVLIALAMNHVVLDPGEALFLRAGTLHSYLDGVGIEVMGNSDNVLRGGLTRKHVDTAEFLAALDFTATPATAIPSRSHGSYPTPAKEFELGRFAVDGEATTLERRGPDIFLAVAGAITLRAMRGNALTLRRGEAAFVPAADGSLEMEGRGVAFRAQVGP